MTVSEIVQETIEKSLEDYFNLRQLDKWREKHSKILERYTKDIEKDLTLQTRLTFFGNFLYPAIAFTFLTGVFMNTFWEWFLLLHWGWWIASGIVFLGIITLIFIGVKRWKGLPTHGR